MYLCILQNNRPEPTQRDNDSGSVDISDITNQNEERRSPTPEPTKPARKSPVKFTSSLYDVMNDVTKPTRSTSETDLASYLLNEPVAPKLDPAYSEPPFQFLQEANKMYMNTINMSDFSRSSSRGSNDNKSDTEVECGNRRTASAKIKQRPSRKQRRNTNPNELSLAQKLLVYKRVMAFKDSFNSAN